MGYFFSPYQIARIAVEVEDLGAEFYRKFAELNINESVREACLILAEEEEAHRESFLGLAREEESGGVSATSALNLAAAMRSVLDQIRSGIFTLTTAEALTASPGEFLRTAARIEEEVITLYEELHFILKGAERAVLEKIIAEEKKHLLILMNVQDKLNLV